MISSLWWRYRWRHTSRLQHLCNFSDVHLRKPGDRGNGRNCHISGRQRPAISRFPFISPSLSPSSYIFLLSRAIALTNMDWTSSRFWYTWDNVFGSISGWTTRCDDSRAGKWWDASHHLCPELDQRLRRSELSDQVYLILVVLTIWHILRSFSIRRPSMEFKCKKVYTWYVNSGSDYIAKRYTSLLPTVSCAGTCSIWVAITW